MHKVIYDFQMFPKNVKNAIYAVAFAWVWYYFSAYTYYYDGAIPQRQLIAGPLICFAVFLGYNWARFLCIFANLFNVVVLIPVAIAFYSASATHFFITIINMALFLFATYLFVVKETAQFYKMYRAPKTGDDKDGKH